ncbi:hypothetical protein KEJ13_09315 [Candidatus Bathyarchaeota archaeon]|nr:hypothetical protein [Candidatus Bathyarchaeota archaeon]
MLWEYRDIFDICTQSLEHPRLTLLMGASMVGRLSGRAMLTLTPGA